MELHTDIIRELSHPDNAIRQIKQLDLDKNITDISATNELVYRLSTLLKNTYLNDPYSLAKAIVFAYHTAKNGSPDSSESAKKMTHYGKILVSKIEHEDLNQITAMMDRFYCYYSIWSNKSNFENSEIELDRLVSSLSGYLYAKSRDKLMDSSLVEQLFNRYNALLSKNRLFCLEGLLMKYPLVYQIRDIKIRLWSDINKEYKNNRGHISIIIISVLRHHLLSRIKKISSKSCLFYEIDPSKMIEQCGSVRGLSEQSVNDYLGLIETIMDNEGLCKNDLKQHSDINWVSTTMNPSSHLPKYPLISIVSDACNLYDTLMNSSQSCI